MWSGEERNQYDGQDLLAEKTLSSERNSLNDINIYYPREVRASSSYTHKKQQDSSRRTRQG